LTKGRRRSFRLPTRWRVGPAPSRIAFRCVRRTRTVPCVARTGSGHRIPYWAVPYSYTHSKRFPYVASTFTESRCCRSYPTC
jgi:hypothetical protein